MYLKIAESKSGNVYVALGYIKYDLFIGLTYDKRNILDYLDTIGYDVPRETNGELKVGLYEIN